MERFLHVHTDSDTDLKSVLLLFWLLDGLTGGFSRGCYAVSPIVWLTVTAPDRSQLEAEMKQAVSEKRVVARKLRQFEDDFQHKHGRYALLSAAIVTRTSFDFRFIGLFIWRSSLIRRTFGDFLDSRLDMNDLWRIARA